MTDRPDPSLPGYRSRETDLVPRMLLRAMFGLAMATLAITSFAVLTDRPPVAQPAPAEVLRERWIVLEGHDAKAVTVRNVDGSLLVDLAHGGFVTVIQSGLATERRKHGIDPLLPVRIVDYANGRLAVEDPETGWSVELHAFGSDNKAAFERLLDQR